MKWSARLGPALVGVIGLGCLATGCSPGHGTLAVVALGDSVPSGAHCGCTPYPQLTGRDLAKATGRRVKVRNDAVSGATTASVLRQLKVGGAVLRRARAADAIEIEIGANDVGYSRSCGTSVRCYAPRLGPLAQNLAAIVARVRASRHKPVVVLLDYWNVWLGGRYAAARGRAYVNAAEEMTDRVDTVIKTTAQRTGSHYVDLRAAFKGPNYAYDETRYLASDGDHPNAAGHRQIAKAVAAALRHVK